MSAMNRLCFCVNAPSDHGSLTFLFEALLLGHEFAGECFSRAPSGSFHVREDSSSQPSAGRQPDRGGLCASLALSSLASMDGITISSWSLSKRGGRGVSTLPCLGVYFS